MMPLALILVGLELLVLSWLADDDGQLPAPRDRADRFSRSMARRPCDKNKPKMLE